MSDNPVNDAFEAVKEGELDRLQEILHAGFDVGTQFKDGKSLLHEAACSENIECCEAILKHGIDPNITDSEGRTPLGYALEISLGGAMLMGAAFGGGMGALSARVGQEKSQKLVDLFEKHGGKAPSHLIKKLGLRSERKWWHFWK